MSRKSVLAVAVFSVLAMLCGCAKATGSQFVKLKEEPKIVLAKGGTNSVQKNDTSVSLRQNLNVPERWQSVASDRTGRMHLYIDAETVVPSVNDIPVIWVRQHPFEQADIDAVTRGLFGDVKVYDAASYTELSGRQGMKALEAPYVFEEELIDPYVPEQGTVQQVNGYVEAVDGNCYQYNLTKTDSFPMKIWAKRIESADELTAVFPRIWSAYDSMKLLYAWVPKKTEFSDEIGMTLTEAQQLADEVVAGLHLPDMHISASEAVLELSLGYSGVPQKKDMTNVGYAFHYTRKLDGVPVTYTDIPGGANAGSSAVRWGYETLDVYVTKDGIDEICFANQYDIGQIDTDGRNLLCFSDIMAVFDKMMFLQNEGILMDKSTDEGDIGAPPQTINYYIDKITLGYMRIYDPQSGLREGKLVPVWDFFGECALIYNEADTKTFRDTNRSFLTINAVTGTVVDRWQGD